MTHDAVPTAAAVPASTSPPSPTAEGGLRHLAALDGLRGLAVVAVIAFHADLLRGGYLGVDLFFVLSGYLITSLLLVEHGRRRTIDLASFWTRRARRLLPALLVVVVVAAAVTLAATASERSELGADALATLLYVANWHAIAGGGGYWAQFSGPPLLEHTWSLAIEEQFYLVWPLVAIVVLGRRGSPTDGSGPRRLLVVSLVGAVASATAMVAGSLLGVTSDRLYLGTDTRVAAILLGASLACATRMARSRPTRRASHAALAGAGWAGAATLAVAWLLLDGRSPALYRGGLLACGLAATAVIASVTVVEHGRLARLLAWRPLVAAGLVSYGLYLWHWPIFVWLDEERTGWSGPALLTVQLALTVALAVLSYRFVEMPVRRGAFATRPALTAVGAMAVTILLVLVVGRPPAPAVDAAGASATITTLGPLTGAGGGTPRVLILGDSVAATIADGVLAHQDRFGIEARSAAVAGCGVARAHPRVRDADGDEIDEAACLSTTARWADEVAAFEPDAVLVVLGWPGHTDRFVDGTWRRPCDPTFDAWYEGELLAALDAASRPGTQVALTTVPYYRPSADDRGTDASTDCLNRIHRAAAAARPGVAVLDLAGHVCPDASCTVDREGVELRPDGLHFAGASGVWAGDWLLRDQWRSAASSSDPS